MPETLTIAVSKGRILKESLPLLARMDIVPSEDPETSRKLVLETNRPGIRLIVVRASDVPVYVEYGAADAGIAGKDVLLEYDGDGLYEPVDLGIARCRLMLAGPRDPQNMTGRSRVATKYVQTTRNYFADLGRQVEIIRLYGSMELAPILGLADLIVDLVDTGSTLKANGLVPLDKIADISSRLVVNKASMKMKQELLKAFVNNLAALVNP
ncbi:MAG TPA: ATP phosphoribosyltransferase [Gammaproteobacteria bacterium]|nr:ATP phosphoribosyltransferase [Gammaproteobacteria bacterium]